MKPAQGKNKPSGNGSFQPFPEGLSVVPPVGLEPTHLSALDFESSVSANSTTGAYYTD